TAESHVCFCEHMQSLFGCDAGKVSDPKRTVGRYGRLMAFVSLHVDPKRHDGDPARRYLQVIRHEARTIVADGNEVIHIRDLASDKLQRFAAVRLVTSIDTELI